MERVKYSDHYRQVPLHGEAANTVTTIDRFHCMERVKYSDHYRQLGSTVWRGC